MRSFFDPAQLGHAPAVELHNGGFTAHADTVRRAEMVLAAIGSAGPATDHGMAPLLRVHTPEYLAFLQGAYDGWQAAGRPGDAVPYVFPVVGRRALDLDRIDALLGRFSYDAATPIAAGSWAAAYGGAQTALTALDAVLAGAPAPSPCAARPATTPGRTISAAIAT